VRRGVRSHYLTQQQAAAQFWVELRRDRRTLGVPIRVRGRNVSTFSRSRSSSTAPLRPSVVRR